MTVRDALKALVNRMEAWAHEFPMIAQYNQWPKAELAAARAALSAPDAAQQRIAELERSLGWVTGEKNGAIADAERQRNVADTLQSRLSASEERSRRLQNAWENLKAYRGCTWQEDHKEMIGLCYNSDPGIAGCTHDLSYDAGEFIEELDKWLQSKCAAALSATPEAQPTGKPPFPSDRCRVCGWPYAKNWQEGCVPGNCSLRPVPAVRADANYVPEVLIDHPQHTGSQVCAELQQEAITAFEHQLKAEGMEKL